MATIIQIPGDLSLAGNIQDIILESAGSVNFKIMLGAEVLLEENYDPDADGKITIRLRDLVPLLLSLSIPTANVFEQTGAAKTFTFNIGGVTSNHVVVAGGVDASIDALTFLKGNWLTWQLQQKRVKYLDPEWLSYYATEAVDVKVKAYFKVGDPVTITLANLLSGKFYSLNTNFQYLTGLFVGQPVYFDIWTEAAAVRLSFIQRYVLMNDYYDSDDIFVFENTLGGIDTIRFTGEKEENNNFEISSALFDEDTQDYEIDFVRVYKKNSGFFASDREREWANEFFNSTGRYLVTAEGLKRVTVSEATAKSLNGDLASINYEFNFALSKQTKFLNFARAETLPENVEIIDPATEVFFLAPRLNEFPAASLNDLLLFPVQSPFTEEWRQISYNAIRDDLRQMMTAAWAEKADLVGGKVPVEQLPEMVGTFSELFEVINPGLENEYVLFKMPLASVGNIKAGVQAGNFDPSIWDGLPTASATVKGGVKVGTGLAIADGVLSVAGNIGGGAWGEIIGNLADQADLVAALNGKASSSHNNSQHSEAYITAAALSPYATNARVAGIEAIMSTDTERTNAVNQLLASYTAADTALNNTITEALVTKAPKDNPVLNGIVTIGNEKRKSFTIGGSGISGGQVVYLRLHPANQANIFSVRVTLKGTWSNVPLQGYLSGEYSAYIVGGAINTNDFRITKTTGTVWQFARLTNVIIENGYASIGIFLTNANPVNVDVEWWDTSDIIKNNLTLSDWSSATVPAANNQSIQGSFQADSFKTSDFELVQSGTNFLLKYQGTTIIRISSAGKIEAGDNVIGGQLL